MPDDEGFANDYEARDGKVEWHCVIDYEEADPANSDPKVTYILDYPLEG